MVDSTLLPAIREAIKQNEIGNTSPYRLSYAQFGKSGASFGIFQGDTNVSEDARATLSQALDAAGADADASTRILAAVSRALPNGNPLSPADTKLANDALSAPEGRALVDQMDHRLLDIVLNELDSSVAAAVSRTLAIDPEAQLYIALWVNMTGAPTTLNRWLAGTTELGVAPPSGPTVTPQDLEAYLLATQYFHLHPRNLVHMEASVTAAQPLLPVA
jgi:hypothetical protein